MENREQYCPICGEEVMPLSRYPDYVCDACESRITDLQGRKVAFYNASISGGLIARRFNPETNKFDIEDKELEKNPVVLIDGIRCYADEAHFGGIVVRKEKI